MPADRPPRLRPVRPQLADELGWSPADSDRALLERLEGALAALPAEERAAAVVAFGLDEGAPGVALELALSREDAEALTRSALQLLRGALADVDPEPPPRPRRRRVAPPRD